MTMTQAAAAETSEAAASALQSYLTSLLYLREEARRDGLHVVAGIMWEALAAIQAWLDTADAPVHHPAVLDSSLCHSLDFLLKWLALPSPGRRRVAQEIARYEERIETGDAVRRPRPRISRKITS